MKDQFEAHIRANHQAGFATGIDTAAASIRDAVRGIPIIARAMGAVLALSIANLSFTPPALAQQAETTQALVTFGDLNISTAAGAAALDNRVRRAAERVCQPDLAVVSIDRAARQLCYRSALAGARQQIEAIRTRTASTAAINVQAR